MEKLSFLNVSEEKRKLYKPIIEHVKGVNSQHTLYEQNKLIMMYEQAAKYIATMERKTNYEELVQRAIYEQNDTGDITTDIKAIMGMIGKVYPNMVTRSIISVQPTPKNTATIFYKDYVRDDDTSLSSDIHANRNYADNEEYNPSSPTDVKEIRLKITNDTVSCNEKKLRDEVTLEMIQDLMSELGMNATSLLDSEMLSEIVREWDRQNLQLMLDGATGGSSTFSTAEPSGLSYEDRKYWMETIYEKIIDVDNQIFKKRFRRTNFIVAGADEASFIEKMKGFRSSNIDIDQVVVQTGGRYEMGTLNNRWKVIVDPFLTGKMLVGYNNSLNFMETPFVFAPYVMAYFTPRVTSTVKFTQARGLLSRAAQKVVVSDLLGIVDITSS